jgi:hypothetical protein
MCVRYSVPMPTVEMIEQKKRDVQAALNYEYKEEDIDRIIEEKNRFRSHPTNYAMRKTQLMKVRLRLCNVLNHFQLSLFFFRNETQRFCQGTKKLPPR